MRFKNTQTWSISLSSWFRHRLSLQSWRAIREGFDPKLEFRLVQIILFCRLGNFGTIMILTTIMWVLETCGLNFLSFRIANDMCTGHFLILHFLILRPQAGCVVLYHHLIWNWPECTIVKIKLNGSLPLPLPNRGVQSSFTLNFQKSPHQPKPLFLSKNDNDTPPPV